MGFNVRIEDLRKVNDFSQQKIAAWGDNMTGLQSGMDNLIKLESFQGKTADSVKAYYSEVHMLMMSAVCTALNDFRNKYILYMDGYYEIDSNKNAKLSEDAMNAAKGQYMTSLSYIDSIQNDLQKILNGISDIFSMSVPGTQYLKDYHENAMEKIVTTIGKVDAYEESILIGSVNQLEDLIQNTRTFIRGYKKGDRSIMSTYVAGDYLKNEDIYALAVSMQESAKYAEENREALLKAIERQKKVYEEIQAEHEAEMAAMRADQGTVQVITGVLIGAVGVVAVIASGGLATPAVAGIAAVSGSFTVAYGVAESVEGAQDIYYGVNGDPYTSAWNPVRDTVFLGNQDVYNVWGKLSMTVATTAIPVGKAMNGLKGADALRAAGWQTMKEIAKKEAGFVADKWLKDPLTDKIADAAGVKSETGKLFIKMGLDAATNPIENKVDGAIDDTVDAIDDYAYKKDHKGISRIEMESLEVKREAEATGKGFAGLMDDEDAAKYSSGGSMQVEIESQEIERDAKASGKGFAGLMDDEDAKRLEEWYDQQEKPDKIKDIEKQEHHDNRQKMAEKMYGKIPGGPMDNPYEEKEGTPVDDVLNELEKMQQKIDK